MAFVATDWTTTRSDGNTVLGDAYPLRSASATFLVACAVTALATQGYSSTSAAVSVSEFRCDAIPPDTIEATARSLLDSRGESLDQSKHLAYAVNSHALKCSPFLLSSLASKVTDSEEHEVCT